MEELPFVQRIRGGEPIDRREVEMSLDQRRELFDLFDALDWEMAEAWIAARTYFVRGVGF
jgi:hypothetical protein